MQNQSELINKLIQELNLTRAALGQVICNYEREHQRMSLSKIANAWIAKSPSMSRDEWQAGARALIHHCHLNNSNSAREAMALLQPNESKYEENATIFRGIHHRKGRGRTSEYFERGVNFVRQDFEIKTDFNREDSSYESEDSQVSRETEQQLARCDNRGKRRYLKNPREWKIMNWMRGSHGIPQQ